MSVRRLSPVFGPLVSFEARTLPMTGAQSSAASLPPTRSVATLKCRWDSRAPADKLACRSGRPARRARQPFGSHFLYPHLPGPATKTEETLPWRCPKILLRRMSAIEGFTGNRSENSAPFRIFFQNWFPARLRTRHRLSLPCHHFCLGEAKERVPVAAPRSPSSRDSVQI